MKLTDREKELVETTKEFVQTLTKMQDSAFTELAKFLGPEVDEDLIFDYVFNDFGEL